MNLDTTVKELITDTTRFASIKSIESATKSLVHKMFVKTHYDLVQSNNRIEVLAEEKFLPYINHVAKVNNLVVIEIYSISESHYRAILCGK